MVRNPDYLEALLEGIVTTLPYVSASRISKNTRTVIIKGNVHLVLGAVMKFSQMLDAAPKNNEVY